jgi:hypothetical protein
MNILFVILLALNIIALIVFFYSPKVSSKVSPNPPKPLQPWTGEQLNKTMDEFHRLMVSYGGTVSDDILHCYVLEVSKMISFDDFMKKADVDKLNFTQQLYQKCSQDPGVKGKWNDELKRHILSDLMNEKNMKPACAMCIIGTLEQNYDPSEINQNSLSQIMPHVLDKCKSEC